MQISRRSAARLLSAACAPSLSAAAPGWTPEWDQALVRAAVASARVSFDPRENMIRSRVGAEYRYHTNLRSMEVHPTRNSFDYALFLLELGQTEPASAILDRLIALQDTDPSSKWYGLWSYYLEEPLPKMAPADWNWADFNGSCLLLIEFRHGSRLAPALRQRIRDSIRHAAASVRRRNVSMTYTNIAVQGTFVTLAAAELLGDSDLLAYATDRLRRFEATVEQTGSFAEYNSPTYANVTISNLTRMLMWVRHADSLIIVRGLNQRAWLHLAAHWHAPTRQLAGPMSRAYSTDIGRPLWLQKALGNRIVWSTLEELKSAARPSEGEVALLDYRLPEELLPRFLGLERPIQHREVFLPASDPVRPVQGTTFLSPEFTLGSVNRGDFWVQRRPLLAFWGKPARWAQMRFLKDDYDLASALLYTVQHEGYVLGLVNFRSPGGDKHLSLDPLPPEFPVRRLRLKLEFAPGFVPGLRTGGNRAVCANLGGGVKLALQIREAAFNDYNGRFEPEDNGINFDLLPPGTERVRWADVQEAYIVFTLAMSASSGSLEEFEKFSAALTYDPEQMSWKTPSARLRIQGGRRVAPAAEQDRAFEEFIDAKPVPLVRLR